MEIQIKEITMQLFKAHKQWASRPADERFGSVEDLLAATKAYAATAVEADVNWADLRTEAVDGDVRLVGKENQPAMLTNWSFGQLASRVGAPGEYLRKLPATLAVQNLNHGLAARESNPRGEASLLIHQNGDMLVRALTSDKYSRIWNWEVAERLLGLQSQGWEPARPDNGMVTLNPSVMGGVNVPTVPNAALYASDHDMFAFMRHPNLALEIGGTKAQREQPVYRGVIAENSEVGARALKLTRFFYNKMCGNHIIWGASEIIDLSLRHVGSVREKMQRWEIALKTYADSAASDEERMIVAAQTRMIDDTKEGVLDRLFGMRDLAVSRKTLEASYDAVVPDQDGDPRTVWGMVQGMTRHSQTLPFADKRTELDRAAGRVLQKIAF